MASKCRKFVPNMFNKTKCQSCFGSKEQHSAEALESNKQSRKVSKCGYLFVAPGYDFSNPLDKTKRWQRRFFVLYDDGELAYSVDENPDTVPQGVVDMNKCTDVKDASGSTSHSNSMAIITPEKTTYIKGNSKEEIQWWQNILIKFPESNTVQKPKFLFDSSNKENISPVSSKTELIPSSNGKENVGPSNSKKDTGGPVNVDLKIVCPPASKEIDVPDSLISPKSDSSESTGDESKGRFEVEKVKQKEQGFATYRGVRSMKHTKADKHHQEGLRKSSSLHDLSTEEKETGSLDKTRFLSRSGDRLDSAEDMVMYSDSRRLLSGYGNNPYATLPRDPMLKSPFADRPLQSSTQDSSSNSSVASAPSQTSTSEGMTRQRRGSFDDKTSKPRNASERARLHRERSASMKSFPTGLTLPKIQSNVGASSVDRLLPRRDSASSGANENETDEHKMAKSTEMQAVSRPTPPPPSPTRTAGAAQGTKFEDLMYMKKGWLIKMGTSEKDCKKHWFVLTGNSLRYYKDAKSEETNALDGRIDLSSCYDISEVQIQRNYGFKIKTRNGEYTLSAMTSGIRSNWMKAIRLCIDLQSGNKNNQSKPADLPVPSVHQRPNDDMDITPSPTSGASDSSRSVDKKDFTRRNVRRHYSDVNPGNINKMFSIKGLGLDKSLNQPVSSSSSSSVSSKEPSVEREVQKEQANKVHSDGGAVSKHSKYEYWSAEGNSGIPFRRFVEGSDNETTTPAIGNEKAGDKQDDEDRKRRAKSPSAKIKDRSRAKSPKLHSPPPGHSQESKFSFRQSASQDNTDKMSVSSDELDFADDNDDQIHLDADDNMVSTMSSAGEGMLVDLLETEVESLKERLEHTQQELAKSHDSNRDLKTKLQTVVREKDPAQLQASLDSSYTAALSSPAADAQQLNTMKRQLKDAKDTVHRQKSEIDQLKSKLDMSVSKLTGTEKALSEALKDVKQEKDKFLKVTTEYNRKVRALEGQLKDVTQKMEKYHENSLIKDKENRKLDLELKQNQQRVRDNDREILKLKAVEHEYRQMKEKFDDTEKYVSRLRMELKEKDEQYKKLEIEYEEQYENMMQDFTKERDDTEHHIEELKTQLLETQRKTSMSEQVSSNVADLLREKDEIIAQLEEKVIESETKMVEMTEELKADEDEANALHQNMEILEEERDNSITKIKDLEKALSFHQSQIQRMEKENASIRKHMDDLRKENTELGERLDSEKSDVSSLVEDNDSLKSTTKDLEQEVHSLHQKLTEVLNHEKMAHPSPELIHTVTVANSEMDNVTDSILNLRKQVESILSNSKGESKSQITDVAEKLEDLGRKCQSVSEVLKAGPEEHSEEIKKQKSAGLESKPESVDKKKAESKKNSVEDEKNKKELTDMQKKNSELFVENKKLKEKMSEMDKQYESQVQTLNKRMDGIASKQSIKVDEKPPKEKQRKSKKKDSAPLPEVIEDQLMELEEKIEMVEKVLQSNDLSISGVESEGHTETEEEADSDSDDSDEFTDSEEETETETETEDEERLEESDGLLGKLKEMKRQLEHTNLKVKEITREIHELEPSKQGSESNVEEELRQTLIRCGEKVNSITTRMSDGLKFARTETPRFSDQTWAFQKCVSKLKEKVTEVSVMVHEHDDLNHKDLKDVQAKIQYLVAYVNEVDKIGENDWDVAGKIAKQELKFQHLLAHKEKATKKSTLKYEDRLQLYADKLAFEAMILGQMGILIQRQQVGVVYKDVLLREIHEANLNILDLERRIDTTTREMNPSDEEKDLVSSYAAMLAERIVLEGQLASCAMVQDLENSENVAVLQALNVDESPTVLAMEIFLRSQLDSSVNDQLQKFAESMDKVSNHIVTRALFQGEISHALQIVKKKFKTSSESEDLTSLVKRERQFGYEQLETRYVNILDLLNETEPLIMTTLIQLIEYTQGPNSPTLDSVCEKITSIVNEKVKMFETELETAEPDTKGKVTNIISHLHSELEDAIVIFREEYHCYVQTASPDINPNMLKFSVDSVCKDLAGMFIQKAVINGSFDFIVSLHKKVPDVQVSQMMDPLAAEGEGLSDLAKCLGQIMLTEAANKQSLANEVRNMPPDNASSIKDLVAVIPDLEAYPQSFDAYASTLVREAMFQSQLTYTTYKLKLEYHRQLRDIRLKLESGEKVVLPSEISREAESDIQVSMTTFEEILNMKYQDECAVLEELEKEIGKLKCVSSEKSCSKCKSFETNLKQLEKTFQHEVSVAQERQNVHSDVLRQEVKNVILRVDKFLEDHEKEKEKMIEDYEDRIATLQDEFELMRVDHEDELEQVKQDIMTAVSAIKATEEEAESSSVDQLKHHNKQLVKLVAMSKELMSDVKTGPGAPKREEVKEKIETLLTHITELEADPTLALDVSLSLSSPDTPSSPPIFADAPKLDRTLSAERSDENVDKLLERSQHEHEMEQLKREKEAALADEIKVTKAALDAMRKAYEEELEQEKDKYRHALKTMFTDNYVEDIRRRHEIEAEKLREELKQISMHYESKCEDYKLLEDRLSRTKGEYQAHINQLVKSNEHLTEHVSNEIEELKKFIQTRTKGHLTGSATLEEELYDSQIMVRVKDAELQKLRSQVKNLENSLERTTEEQRYTMTQYLTCLKKNQELQAKLKEEVLLNKERRDSTAHEEQLSKNARALRRNPSFHQRARSPSPEASPRKDNSEHHSRDSHRRSRGHLSAKDLKRSQSSPSLPYVFDAKAGLVRSGQTAASSRRDSTKYSKSPKK